MKSLLFRGLGVAAFSLFTALFSLPSTALAQSDAKAMLTFRKPADGSVFVAPAEVRIELVAVDPDGDIRRVEFYANGELIGVSEHLTRDAVIPGRPREHVFLWKVARPGEYKLGAKAKATNGSTVEAAGVAITVTGVANGLVLIPQGASWKFLNNGTDPGAEWKALDFADTDWRSGPAQIGYGDGDEATVSTEGATSPHPISAYFRRKFEVNALASVAGLTVRLVRDDGAVVYLNGQELLRDNMPSGDIKPDTLASGNATEENAFHVFNVPAAALKPGQNILAVEVHQVSATSSDLSFDLELALTRPVIETPVVSIVADPAETSEPIPAAIGNATGLVLPGKFIIRRTGETDRPLSVYVGYAGTATMDLDYGGLPSTVVIPAGERSTSILVLAKGDNLIEETETVIAKLGLPPAVVALDTTDAVLINGPYSIDPAASTATVKIRDANGGGGTLPVISIEATRAETREPSRNERIAPGEFTLKRTGPANESLTVYLRFDGTATAGSDYARLEQTATFAAGAESTTLLVEPIDDQLMEGDETVVARLVAAPIERVPYYRIDPEKNTARVVIHDNDREPGPATIVINTPTNGQAFRFGTEIQITATAIDPRGYIPRVEFFDRDTRIGVSEITFVRAPDPGTPIDHSFLWKEAKVGEHVLTAVGFSSVGTRVSSAPVRITVTALGETTVSVTAADAEATEFSPLVDAIDPAQFVISREGDLSRSEAVFFAFGGTATAGTDYELPTSPIVIPAGEKSVNVTIVPKSDEVQEKMETVSIRLLPSPALSPLPTYKIDPLHKDAAAVIYDRERPSDGALELALPTSGDVFGQRQNIHLVAAAYHPTVSLLAVDFYADGEKIGSSALAVDTADATQEGGLFFHGLEWVNPPAGSHVLTARAVLSSAAQLVSSEVRVRVEGDIEIPTVSIRFLPDLTERPFPDADYAPGSLEISRTGPTDSPLKVFFKVGGTATPEADYVPLGSSATLAEGQRSVFLTVEAKDDKLHEGDETVVVGLVSPPVTTAGAIALSYRIDPEHNTATVTIIDNDPEPGPATLEITRPANGDNFAFGETIRIVAIAIDPSGYISRVEFYDGDNRIGVSEVHFIVAPAPGTPIEHSFEWRSARPGDHSLTARAVDSQGRRVVSPPVKITVGPVPDRVVLAIEAVDAVATEPSDNSVLDTATFVIKRVSGPQNIPVEVFYRIDGTAKNGTDYSEISSRLLLPAGAASAEIVIKPRADNLVEGEETVVLALLPAPCIAIFPPPPGCYEVGKPGEARAVIRDRNSNENKPPVVKIVRPSNGAVFTLGETIGVRAEASDADGSVKKLEIYAEDKLLGSSENGELTVEWTPARPGSYGLRARAVDDKGADASTSIRLLVREVNTVAFVQRVLPGGYTPGQPLPVKLNAVPPDGTSAYAIEDQPPAGWVVTEISDEGVFDSATGKVKFGPFTDARERSLTYQVTPPANASGRYEFTGNSSANGKAYPIGGDHVIEGVNSKHPADQNTDRAINLVELTGYAAAWKNGDSWPSGPVPIPVSYVTRAGFLWKRGEAYVFDPASGAPPLCWVPANQPPPRLSALFVESAHCERSGPPAPLPGAALTFSIAVNPPSGTTSYAVEERIPEGWIVQSISDDGEYDSESNSIRWGLFLDATARVLSYVVQAPAGISSIAEFGGVVSFDGTVERIKGLGRVVAVDGHTQVRLTDCRRDRDGKAHLQVAGGVGQLCVLEASSDLVNWTEVGTTFLPDGQVEYQDESATTDRRRYYRLRVR